jgi:hypothetical protein
MNPKDVAREQRFSFLRFGMTSPEPRPTQSQAIGQLCWPAVADDRLVSEEGVLDAGLLVVP